MGYRIFDWGFLSGQCEEWLIKAQSQVELITALLYPEHRLGLLSIDIQIFNSVVPVVEILILLSFESRWQLKAGFLKVSTLLLSFPIVTKHFFYTTLVEVKLLFDLSDPDYFACYFWEISLGVQRVVVLVFSQHFSF
jgi:hypothetical protein